METAAVKGQEGTIGKILALFSQHERRHLYRLLPAVIVMALVQVMGIASVTPFLAVVADPDTLHNNVWLHRLYTALNFTSPNSFLLFLGIAVLGVLALSNAFTMFVTWMLLRFVHLRNHTLSQRLLTSYLHRPYPFFLNRNSADLSKSILGEVKEVVRGVLLPGMQLLAKLTVVLFILLLLLVADPILALSVSVLLGGAYTLIFGLVRQRLSRIGEKRVKARRRLFEATSEAIGGIKEAKLLGRESEFIRRFAKPSQRYASYQASQQVIAQLPRYALETVAFGSIILIVLYLLAVGRDIDQALPLLGLYAFAGYRLMPALQEVFSAMASLRYNMAALDMLYEDLKDKLGDRDFVDRQALAALPFRDRLELRTVSFAYSGAKGGVFTDLDLTIKAKSSVAFVGSTGSGKTTLADLILGLLRPQEGCLVVDGIEINDSNLPNWQKNIGYVPQSIYLCDESVAQSIAFGVPPEKIDMAAVERAARLANIHDFIVNDLPEGYHTKAGERGIRLSGGQRQRIGIARALYHDPEVLVLDEATSALDGVTEENVFRAVENLAKSKTIIMIAHRISTVRHCDMIFLLERGRVIAQGNYQDLLHSSPQFRAIAQLEPVEVEFSNA